MRYTVAHRGKFPVSDDVKEQIIFEEHLGLFEPSTYDNFRERCEESRDNLMDLLSSVVEQQKTIVGYAATSKSTTVLNYCGINEKLLPYIVDTTPCKQGRVSPGMHVPIRPSSCFSDPYPDYALLFAYNHKKEIFAKESEFSRRGGKWILFVPEVGIIEQN